MQLYRIHMYVRKFKRGGRFANDGVHALTYVRGISLLKNPIILSYIPPVGMLFSFKDHSLGYDLLEDKDMANIYRVLSTAHVFTRPDDVDIDSWESLNPKKPKVQDIIVTMISHANYDRGGQLIPELIDTHAWDHDRVHSYTYKNTLKTFGGVPTKEENI